MNSYRLLPPPGLTPSAPSRPPIGKRGCRAVCGISPRRRPCASTVPVSTRSDARQPCNFWRRTQLDPVHGGRRARHHTTTDADSDVEKIPHARNMQVRAETSANGGSTHEASGQAARAGSRAEALKGQTPLHRAPGYVKWNQDKQCHEPTLQHDNHQVHAGANGAHNQGVIHAFHALGGMAADKDKSTMFKLTLSMEGPKKKQQIREALIAL